MYNCHAHLFTSDHIPSELLKLYVPFLPNILVDPLNSFVDSRIGNFLLGWTSKYGEGALKRYGNFLKLGYQTSLPEQFEILRNAYPVGTRFVILTQNFQYISKYSPKISYASYKQELYHLKRSFPDIILPFHFIEPRLIDNTQDPKLLLREIEEDFHNGYCVGLKMYPAEGYYPFDFRIKAIYEFADANKIPIITHASIGGSRYVKKTTDAERYPVNLDGTIQKMEVPSLGWLGNKFTERARIFSDPDNYRALFTKYRDLKICMAHAGSDAEIDIELANIKHKTNRPNWYRKIITLMDDFENAYVDISYSLHKLDFIESLVMRDFNPSSIDSKIVERSKRMLFGSDFYMTYTEFTPDSRNQSGIENKLWDSAKKKMDLSLFQSISETNAYNFLKSSYYS